MKKKLLKVMIGLLVVVGVMCAGLVVYGWLKLAMAYEIVAPVTGALVLIAYCTHEGIKKQQHADREHMSLQVESNRLQRRLECLELDVKAYAAKCENLAMELHNLRQYVENVRQDLASGGINGET
jgi:energy-converting hydrogenase Eha subunit C